MKRAFFQYVTIIPALALGLLAGCGGGGGGGGSAAFTSAASSGAVADGIVRNGQVVANELDATGSVVSQLGTATTDANGQYSITIPASYTGGPIDFVLTGDAGTTMVCDVPNTISGCGARTDALTDPNSNGIVDFGEEMSVDGLSMEAIIAKANSGDTLSVNITPFTTAAARRARLATTLDATAVNNANSAISNLLGGLDIVALQPLDLTDPNALSATGVTRAQITYAALASAIGALTKQEFGSVDVTHLSMALDKLSTSVSGSTISAATGSDTTYSLDDIVNAAINELDAAGSDDQTGVLTLLANEIATAKAGSGIIDVQPNPNAGNTDIARAKALVQEMRTWGVSLTDLWNSGSTFRDTVDSAGAVADPLVTSIGNSLGTAVDTMLAIYGANQGADGQYSYDLSILGGGTGTGNVTISTSGGTVTVSLTGTVNTETVDNLAISFTAPTGQVSSFAMNILGDIYTTDSNSPGASLSITSGTASVNFISPIDPSSASTIDISNVASAGFNLQATVAQINTNNPVSFTGTVTITNAISVGTAPDQAFVPSSILLDGTVADTSNSVQTTISATVSNPAAYDPASQDPGFALQGTLSVVVNLNLSGLPRAKLTVTVNKTGSDADTGNGSIILSQAGETITVTGSQTGTSSSLTVTDTANASLTISFTAPGANGTGTVKVGSATVGDVKEIAGGIIKVSYNDGTFETLQ